MYTEDEIDAKDQVSKFNVLIVGDQGTGKSTILKQYSRNTKSSKWFGSTKKPSLNAKLNVSGKEVQLNIYDSNTDEKVDALMFVYDISRPESFDKVKELYRRYQKDIENNGIVTVLVGNKADLRNKNSISREGAARFGVRNNFNIIGECSATKNNEINKKFALTAAELLKREQGLESNASTSLVDDTQIQDKMAKEVALYKDKIEDFITKRKNTTSFLFWNRLQNDDSSSSVFKRSTSRQEKDKLLNRYRKGFIEEANNLEELQNQIGTLKYLASQHRDSFKYGFFAGIKGIIKFNWLRNTASLNELNKQFDDLNQLKDISSLKNY